jgi:catechol 2,3-dioxygenase-like lactoylglutathione lyase family enzyme
MLTEMHAVLPAADLGRARKFYHDMLGLDPVEEHEEGRLLTDRVNGSAFDIYETENAGSAKNTQLCFNTDSLSQEMRMLRERGVMFEEFEIPGMKTENGVVEDEEGMTAWFRDSEGNFLCLTELKNAAMGGRMGSQMSGQMESGQGGSSMGSGMGESSMGSGMGGSETGSGMGGSETGSGMGGSEMGSDTQRM